jgi:hypothetical protein
MAGIKFVAVNICGTVSRCVQDDEGFGFIGDPEFRLADRPMVCPYKRCSCPDLWEMILDKPEDAAEFGDCYSRRLGPRVQVSFTDDDGVSWEQAMREKGFLAPVPQIT